MFEGEIEVERGESGCMFDIEDLLDESVGGRREGLLSWVGKRHSWEGIDGLCHVYWAIIVRWVPWDEAQVCHYADVNDYEARTYRVRFRCYFNIFWWILVDFGRARNVLHLKLKV